MISENSLNAIVLYASKSGNSAKIAEAISSELYCKTVKIDEKSLSSPINLDNIELVVIGTGIYAGAPNKDIENYLKTTNLGDPKKFALFISWGGAGKTLDAVITKLKAILEAKGHRVLKNTFNCYGGWKYALLKRGHPNNEDLEAAISWAKNLASNLQE
ncbi:MAG: hypothetical protein GX638_02990 [Crenarchaeota archaeon]|nr:hypothetical protein [Thermoproteota archaeon]